MYSLDDSRPYVQLGEVEEGVEAKPPRASLPKGQFMEEILFETALELLKLPRKLGEHEGEEIIATVCTSWDALCESPFRCTRASE